MRTIWAIARSPSIQSAAVFAASGAAFAAGNLLVARGLSQSDFGHLALMLAILAVISNIAPLGRDQVLLRRAIPLTRRYLRPIVISASAIAIGVAALARLLYALPWAETLVLLVATIVFALLRTIAAALRRHGHALLANALDTCSDWILLLLGIATVAGVIQSSGATATLFAAAGALIACGAARTLHRAERDMTGAPDTPSPGEAASLVGIVAAGAVLVQSERLLVPLLLSIDQLAVLAVLAAVAIAPFRVLSAGIVASLSQQLRELNGREARLRLLTREVRLVTMLTLIACVTVVSLAPFTAHVLTGGRYELSLGLCAAACLNGVVKIMQAIPRAISIGIGSSSDLHRLNALLWMCVVGTVVGAISGAPQGLSMLVLGASLGSGVGTLVMLQVGRTILGPNARLNPAVNQEVATDHHIDQPSTP